MKRPTTAALAALLILAFGLAACSEKPQTAGARKADTAPYSTATGTNTAPGWKLGDATSWESHMAARTQAQNEYRRTSN